MYLSAIRIDFLSQTGLIGQKDLFNQFLLASLVNSLNLSEETDQILTVVGLYEDGKVLSELLLVLNVA